MRQTRQQLSPSEQAQAACNMTMQLQKSRLLRRSQHIAAYLADDGEMDTNLLMHYCWQNQKIFYLPIVDPLGNRKLSFAEHHADSLLVPNRFGIPEPAQRTTRPLPLWALDIILMPLVAFDKQGYRLGRGGGFYDYTLRFLKHGYRRNKPYLVGLAYSWQQVSKLPHEDWDIPLAAVVTEQETIIFKESVQWLIG